MQCCTGNAEAINKEKKNLWIQYPVKTKIKALVFVVSIWPSIYAFLTCDLLEHSNNSFLRGGKSLNACKKTLKNTFADRYERLQIVSWNRLSIKSEMQLCKKKY